MDEPLYPSRNPNGGGGRAPHNDPYGRRGSSEEEEPVSNELEPNSSNMFKNITIEPLMFLHMLGMAGSSVVVQNMYLQRICLVTLNQTESICSNLSAHEDVEKSVEAEAVYYTTYRGLIEAGFPVIFSLFLGPWTDIHGTKYPILMPLLGYALSALTYLVLTFAQDLRPSFLLFASLPVALTGGMVALIMSVFSFMSKITTKENRSFRVAMLEASWFLGSPLGLVGGGYIFQIGGFPYVFITSSILFAMGFIYGAVVLQGEGPPGLTDEEGRPRPRTNCCADMFNVSAVKDIFATIVVERPGRARAWMHIMLLTIFLRIFIMMGYLNTMYLYTRNKFHWELRDYTEYSVADSFITITGSYVMIMITMRIFKLEDALVGIIGSVGSLFGTIIFAFATGGWMVYLGSCVSMFSGLISIIIRAMLSKIVAKEEVAKVFTFLAAGEATMPLLATPLYNLVFGKTLAVFPGAVFLISTTAYGVILAAFLYLYVSMRRVTPHESIQEEEQIRA